MKCAQNMMDGQLIVYRTKAKKITKEHNILEKVAINDALPLKAARRNASSKLKSFGASNLSCRKTQCRFI